METELCNRSLEIKFGSPSFFQEAQLSDATIIEDADFDDDYKEEKKNDENRSDEENDNEALIDDGEQDDDMFVCVLLTLVSRRKLFGN